MPSDLLTILEGDALEKLRELPDESVQCCVTSPPFWGLRDYGTAKWEGGAENCDHRVRDNPRIESSTRSGGKESTGHQREGFKSDCPRCGAKRIDAQLGLEKTPEDYVAKLVEVFREVRRVLRKDGTLWLNLGDSYYRDPAKGDRAEYLGLHKNIADSGCHKASQMRSIPAGMKAKDLVGIPWMVAFALRADGWWLRSDIIWAKPNPMPESVIDRPTKSHEYIFLLTKSDRYFYDAAAIAEPVSQAMLDQIREGYQGQATKDFGVNGAQDASATKSRILAKHRKPAGWDTGQGAHGTIHRNGRSPAVEYSEIASLTRNKRSVWTVTTQAYPEAHFATFPEEIPKLCVLAGTRVGDSVLDPFAGSGTTGMVAIELGRKAVLIELNPDYVELIKQRCNVTPGLALA